jgi:hypothetical protein
VGEALASSRTLISVPCAGHTFAALKKTEDVRRYAGEQGIAEKEALQKGMEENLASSPGKGSELYAEAVNTEKESFPKFNASGYWEASCISLSAAGAGLRRARWDRLQDARGEFSFFATKLRGSPSSRSRLHVQCQVRHAPSSAAMENLPRDESVAGSRRIARHD